MDSIVRKEGLELTEKLVSQGLVVSHDQRRPLGLGNHMRHGEGLTAACDAEQNLRRVSALDPGDQLFDSAWLVARGHKIGFQLERGRHDRVSTDRRRAT